jgi:hypothetical protein
MNGVRPGQAPAAVGPRDVRGRVEHLRRTLAALTGLADPASELNRGPARMAERCEFREWRSPASFVDSGALSLANVGSGQKTLTLGQLPAILQACVPPSGRSLRSGRRGPRVENSCSRILPCAASWTYLARSDRRFRPYDRLLWLCLRRSWPRWREALMLVQPATVARCIAKGSWMLAPSLAAAAGRPCIDSQLRALIRRMATENRLD